MIIVLSDILAVIHFLYHSHFTFILLLTNCQLVNFYHTVDFSYKPKAGKEAN